MDEAFLENLRKNYKRPGPDDLGVFMVDDKKNVIKRKDLVTGKEISSRRIKKIEEEYKGSNEMKKAIEDLQKEWDSMLEKEIPYEVMQVLIKPESFGVIIRDLISDRNKGELENLTYKQSIKKILSDLERAKAYLQKTRDSFIGEYEKIENDTINSNRDLNYELKQYLNIKIDKAESFLDKIKYFIDYIDKKTK